jgi:hypothetical protein
MAVYTVHEPPLKGGATPEPERFVFVRDGFSFWALLFGPLWMLRHRMVLVLLGYLAVVAALAILLRVSGSAGVGSTVWTLLALLLGFEAATLRRFTLRRRRFRNVGVVVGDDLELAERRFYDAWIRGSSRDQAATRDEAVATYSAARLPDPSSPVLGLFPEPGASP